MKKKVEIKERIKCKDCPDHYDPDFNNLNSDREPIMCKCKHLPFMVLMNYTDNKCPNK